MLQCIDLIPTAQDVPLQQGEVCVQGWEDLRLDERLMQLVRTFAVILRSDPDTARRQLLPCPLSVTPLGASMGLIQWVDHTMPLYGVYKAWQHRQLTDKAGMLACDIIADTQHCLLQQHLFAVLHAV